MMLLLVRWRFEQCLLSDLVSVTLSSRRTGEASRLASSMACSRRNHVYNVWLRLDTYLDNVGARLPDYYFP